MASRTGNQRLITLRAAAAGAGVSLALAAGVSLGGCGGSSDAGPTVGSTAVSEGTEARQTRAGSPKTGTGTAPAADSNGQAGAGHGAGKHGPSIAPPKGPREHAPTAKEVANATVASMTLNSPALGAATSSVATLPAAYTCDGKNSWPALRWIGVPAGTAELILFAMNAQSVGGDLFFDWAVAGIAPDLTGIEASRLPTGAVVGRSSFGKRGYSICPSAGGETFVFALYALPKRLFPKPGFDPGTLRQEVLDVSGNAGFLPVYYARR